MPDRKPKKRIQRTHRLALGDPRITAHDVCALHGGALDRSRGVAELQEPIAAALDRVVSELIERGLPVPERAELLLGVLGAHPRFLDDRHLRPQALLMDLARLERRRRWVYPEVLPDLEGLVDRCRDQELCPALLAFEVLGLLEGPVLALQATEQMTRRERGVLIGLLTLPLDDLAYHPTRELFRYLEGYCLLEPVPASTTRLSVDGTWVHLREDDELDEIDLCDLIDGPDSPGSSDGREGPDGLGGAGGLLDG